MKSFSPNAHVMMNVSLAGLWWLVHSRVSVMAYFIPLHYHQIIPSNMVKITRNNIPFKDLIAYTKRYILYLFTVQKHVKHLGACTLAQHFQYILSRWSTKSYLRTPFPISFFPMPKWWLHSYNWTYVYRLLFIKINHLTSVSRHLFVHDWLTQWSQRSIVNELPCFLKTSSANIKHITQQY